MIANFIAIIFSLWFPKAWNTQNVPITMMNTSLDSENQTASTSINHFIAWGPHAVLITQILGATHPSGITFSSESICICFRCQVALQAAILVALQAAIF